MAKAKAAIQTRAVATAMPPGSVPPTRALDDGEYTLRIMDMVKAHPVFDEEKGTELVPFTEEELEEQQTYPRTYVEVEYPDGYVREHHALDMADLLTKIVANLRYAYGIESTNIISAADYKVGGIIKVGVVNGA